MQSPAPIDTPNRVIALVRHGESTYNVAGFLNGDPGVPVELTGVGRTQAEALAARLEGMRFDVAVHSGFPRTRETLAILLGAAQPPWVEIPDLGDVRVGIFEGRSVVDYRDWRADHRNSDAPPGGESRLETLARYTRGFRALRDLPGSCLLAVLHDITIRFVLNAARGSDPFSGPVTRVRNCELYHLAPEELERALVVMEARLDGAPERYPVR